MRNVWNLVARLNVQPPTFALSRSVSCNAAASPPCSCPESASWARVSSMHCCCAAVARASAAAACAHSTHSTLIRRQAQHTWHAQHAPSTHSTHSTLMRQQAQQAQHTLSAQCPLLVVTTSQLLLLSCHPHLPLCCPSCCFTCC